MESKDLADLRKDYSLKELDESLVSKDPMSQFKKWLDEAIESKIPEPNAMQLATVNREGKPTIRTVLLKGMDQEGLIFYSNYSSRKAQEILNHDWVALNFVWIELERQVRIEGQIVKKDDQEAVDYFHSRPVLSQIGAWASPQSQEIEDRKMLEDLFEEYKNKFEGQEIPKPSFWGGYKIIPSYFEFWQGRRSRLHDRVAYTNNNSNWQIKRLAP